jgi:hypothetical protein
MMLPNFTYAEFLKLVQHVMVRQRILLSGDFKEKRERSHRLGYVLDFDSSPLTAEDRKLAEVRMTDAEMNMLVELGYLEATLICSELLHIPAPKPTPKRPLKLAPLGAPLRKAKKTANTSSDSESDAESDDVDTDDDDPPVSEPFSGHGTEEARTIAVATHDTARYSALCDDYEDAVKELDQQVEPPVVAGPSPPPSPLSNPGPTIPIPVRSEIIDASGRLSIAMMLQARLHWQAGTTTRSEKVSQIDSKYALARIARGVGSQGDDTEPEKMTLQEVSNLARVLQEQNSTIQESKPRKYRELRWKDIAKAVQKQVDANGEYKLFTSFCC